MGSGSGSSTTTVKKLPDYCTPYINAFLVRAVVYSRETYIPYWLTSGASPTYAPQNAYETTAIGLLATRGRSGNATILAAITYIQDVLDGDYLLGTDSKFIAALLLLHNAIVDAGALISPLLGGEVHLMGSSGENLAQTLFATRAATWSDRSQKKVGALNYALNRRLIEKVLAAGIEYAAQSIKDAEMLRMSGLYQRDYDQGYYADIYDKWVDVEQWKVRKLEILGNALRALVGTQYNKTEPFHKPNPLISTMGGAMSGAAAGYMIASSSAAAGGATAASGAAAGASTGSAGGYYGAAIGAVIGGLMGFLSSR